MPLAPTPEQRPARLARGLLLGSWSTTLLTCLGVLLPKCPLCLAAYLCLFGLSASTASALARLGLPLCLSALALTAVASAVFVARSARGVDLQPLPQAPCACRNSTPKAEPHLAGPRDHQPK